MNLSAAQKQYLQFNIDLFFELLPSSLAQNGNVILLCLMVSPWIFFLSEPF